MSRHAPGLQVGARLAVATPRTFGALAGRLGAVGVRVQQGKAMTGHPEAHLSLRAAPLWGIA